MSAKRRDCDRSCRERAQQVKTIVWNSSYILLACAHMYELPKNGSAFNKSLNLHMDTTCLLSMWQAGRRASPLFRAEHSYQRYCALCMSHNHRHTRAGFVVVPPVFWLLRFSPLIFAERGVGVCCKISMGKKSTVINCKNCCFRSRQRFICLKGKSTPTSRMMRS